jgi:cytosine/adenosine deaminase-related metal-dependent hydrolase
VDKTQGNQTSGKESYSTTSSFILKNVRPWDGQTVDVLVCDGIIQEIAAGIAVESDTLTSYEGEGQILLPGLVNAHAHLDDNLLGVPWPRNEVPASGIEDMIHYSREVWKSLGLSSRVQSLRQVRASIAAGITHIRSHVHIQPDYGMKHVEGVLQTRAEYQGLIDIQLVAFPQLGVVDDPATLGMMEEALKLGVECVGGIDPSSRNRDPVGHLNAIFGLAEHFGKEIDIHLHEPDHLGAFAVELIAERTRALGMQGRVTISHAFCLGMVDDAYLEKLIGLLAQNRIRIQSAGAGGTAVPPIKKLVEAGVTVCIGTDGVRDIWSGFNTVDMLDRIKMLAYRLRYKRDDEIEMLLNLATNVGAGVLGDPNYGFAVGRKADLIVLPGTNLKELVIDQPRRSFIFKGGKLVAAGGQCLIPDDLLDEN